MKLNAPTQHIWIIAVILGVLSIVVHYGVDIDPIKDHTFELLAIGFVLLVAGTMFKKL